MRAADEVLAALFEGAPRFTARLEAEPAESWAQLIDRAERIALAMPEDEQVELLDSHPRIGAPAATLSQDSYREQGYERDRATGELQERLDELNDAYESSFGFRFVVFVNGRPRDEIANLLERSLAQPREAEKRRGLLDVIAIARSRLRHMREEDE